jgi:hypothetical protein
MTLKRTGIKRGTKKLTRSTRLQSRGLIGREWAIKPVRPKRTPEETYGRDKVDDRATVDDEIVCEIWLPGCTWYGTDWHHRRNHGQGGPWDPANGMKACRHCHDAVTVTRDEWSVNGWWLKEGEDWLTKPVLRRRQWVVLDNEGSFTPSLPFEEAS